jgi:hypothetical protein
VILLAVLYSYAPSLLRLDHQRLGAGAVLASIIAALLLGVAVHRFSASLLVINRVLYRESALTGIVRRFEHLPMVQAKVAKYLRFYPKDAVDAYYYGKLLVDEKMPRTADAAERLMSMAVLCRNMLVAIPIAFVALMRRNGSDGRTKRLSATIGLAIGALFFEALFLRGFLSYWSASVWRILRAVVTLP